MFITNDEAQRRLNSTKNLANSVVKPFQNNGSGAGEINPTITHKPLVKPGLTAPLGLKTIAQSLVAQGEKRADVQAAFNLSAGQTRTGDEQRVAHTIERVRDLALDKMLIAMGLMTQDKFENASLKDLGAVTAHLSRVIEKTQPRESGTNVQFVIHAPAQKSLGMYRTIDV
jgi:hypothetical protein